MLKAHVLSGQGFIRRLVNRRRFGGREDVLKDYHGLRFSTARQMSRSRKLENRWLYSISYKAVVIDTVKNFISQQLISPRFHYASAAYMALTTKWSRFLVRWRPLTIYKAPKHHRKSKLPWNRYIHSHCLCFSAFHQSLTDLQNYRTVAFRSRVLAGL